MDTGLDDLWLDFVFWGGGVGFTLGMLGALLAYVLAWLGYRRVVEVPDSVGWSPQYEMGEPPRPVDWFSSWTLVGGVLGGAMGVVFWFDRVL